MRLGRPFVPVLKQHHGDRERTGERLSSARQNADRAKLEAWNEVCLSQDELSSSAPLSARSSAGSTKASSLTRTARRSSNRGTFHLKGGKLSAGCSSSTGGTGSGTGLARASALSSFWSHIDDLDQDLQQRAAQLNGKARSRCASTPTEAAFPRTPDLSSKDVGFVETPESSDMFFVDGPDVSFFDHRGITDAEFVCMEGTSNLDDCSINMNLGSNRGQRIATSSSNWLVDLPVANLLQGDTFETPIVCSALSSPDVSTVYQDSPNMLPRNAKTSARQAPPAQRTFQTQAAPRSSSGSGDRTTRGSGAFAGGRSAGRLPPASKGDVVVDQLTWRIRQLEEELDQAATASGSRSSVEKKLPRRSGSAPPATRHQANNALMPNMVAPSATSLVNGIPQATPRIMCRQTLTESEGQGLDPGAFLFVAARNRCASNRSDPDTPPSPSRLAHLCQVMQAERKCLLDTLYEICNQVGVSTEPEEMTVESKVVDSLPEAAQNHAASPRRLISRLRDAHLSLHARLALDESAEGTHKSATSTVMGELHDTFKAPVIVNDAVVPSSRPFAGALAAARALLLDADDIRKAYDDLTPDDRGDLKELAKCIGEVDSKLFGDCGLLSGSCEVAVPLAETFAVDKALRAPPVSNAIDVSTVAPTSADQPRSQSLTRSSPQSSCGSLPAVGRLSELVDEKQREVNELQERCDRACASSEEHLEASTLLASSREELRLLREFLGASSEGAEQGFEQR